MKNKKTLEMVQMAVLIAIILVMAFTSIGYIRTAGLSISSITIPVVIGAMIIGPKAGLILGTVFGLTSFYQCFGLDPFGATLLSINPFLTFLVCIPTRALMGWLVGVIFNAVKKIDKTKIVCYFVGGLMGAFLNTLFFMGMLILCFWNTEYMQGLNTSLFGGVNPLAFVFGFVGINGLLEMPAACIGGGVISKALNKAFKNM
ncbi:MAG: ECF transporter S component [Lachnospiraceae bacterium]|nr:ECF transporter S component [Lachnospiraceae bacterium]